MVSLICQLGGAMVGNQTLVGAAGGGGALLGQRFILS